MKEMIKRAEALTKLLMTGYRDGPEKRREWMHPQDVVELVKQIPGISEGMRDAAQTVAWLHDIIEDTEVTEEDLLAFGFPGHVVSCVRVLSKTPGQTAESYYYAISAYNNNLVRMVKGCDRIANLTEGALTFKNARWARYVRETEQYVIPMVEKIRGYEDLPHTKSYEQAKNWLLEKLRAAMAARHVAEHG